MGGRCAIRRRSRKPVTRGRGQGSAAGDIVDAVFEVIAEGLAMGEDLRVVGFGTFGTRGRPARTGRNPRTGESLKIAAWTVPTFNLVRSTSRDAGRVVWCGGNREPLPLDLAQTKARSRATASGSFRAMPIEKAATVVGV